MALIINKAAPAGSDQANTYDDDMRTLKLALQDIFGIPDNTTIATKLMTVLAAGLQKLHLQDTAAAPTGAGDLQRNAAELLFYDGSNALKVFLVASGDRMIFDQDAAPTEWTRDAVIDDKVIRIVTGARADGGSWTISGLTSAAHTLALSEIPAHGHGYVKSILGFWWSAGEWNQSNNPYTTVAAGTTDDAGGGGSHTHGLTAGSAWRPLHRDMILCEKD